MRDIIDILEAQRQVLAAKMRLLDPGYSPDTLTYLHIMCAVTSLETAIDRLTIAAKGELA